MKASDTRSPHGSSLDADVGARDGTERHARRNAGSRPLAITVGLAACLLTGPSRAEASSSENGAKQVENRGSPSQTHPGPSGPTPDRPSGTAPSSKAPEKCNKDHPTAQEQTPTVEEKTTVVEKETVVVEVRVETDPTLDDVTFPEVVQDTLGRRQAGSVAACTDPRYPLPSYAFVGIQPVFAPRSPGDTVRLERIDCELEVESAWEPNHSLFTLAAGPAMFQVAPGEADRTEIGVVAEMHGGTRYPVAASISRSGSSGSNRRFVASFRFIKAESGQAPRLQPEDTVYLSIDPSPDAPPGYRMPKFVLVDGTRDVPSTLRLVEKSGTRTSVLPAVSELELAAFCRVVHRLPR